jgi:hypothetical protein
MQNENLRPKLRQLSGIGEALALLGAVGVGGFSVATWFDQAALISALTTGLPRMPLPAGNTLLTAYLISLVPAAIFVIAMLQAWRLFALLKRGRIFIPAVPQALSLLGAWAVASAVAGMVVRTVLGLVLTADGPPGTRALVIGVGSNEIASLVMALLLFTFAVLMREAIALDEDSRGIV